MTLTIIKDVDPLVEDPIVIREQVTEILLEADGPLRMTRRADGRTYIEEMREGSEDLSLSV